MDDRRDSVTSPVFSYQPLESHRGEIRLLEIQPSSSLSTPVHCRVRHACIWNEPRPVYEAISYAWGDVSKKSSIIANGDLLELPASAEECLRYVRRSDRPRTVWIDAGSIHQADQAERSTQVAMMADIYRHSLQALVWLGEPDESTSLVGGQVRRLLDELYSPEGEATMQDTHNERRRRRSSDAIGPLLDLFQRPWFSRLWVIQEIALAPRSQCQCGDFRFETLDLLRVALWISVAYTKPFSCTGVDMASRIRSYCDEEYGGKIPSTMTWHNILGLMTATTSYMECTDPRDRIYAVLGLMRGDTNAQVPGMLSPDYGKSTLQVYRDATRWLCQEYGVPTMIALVRHRFRTDVDGQAPSWVHRWDRTWDPYCDPVSLTAPYDAARWFPESTNALSDDPNRVKIAGYIIGKVASCTSLPSRWNFSARYQLRLYKTIQRLASKLRPHETRGQTWKAVVCTMVAESMNSGERDDLADICRAAASYWGYIRREKVVPDTNDRFEEDVDERTQLAAMYHNGLIGALFNRSLFVSTGGDLGLAPMLTKAGDVVAILYECQLPLILRPCGGGYRIVGEAYVFGMMDGEAVRQRQDRLEEPTVFDIR